MNDKYDVKLEDFLDSPTYSPNHSDKHVEVVLGSGNSPVTSDPPTQCSHEDRQNIGNQAKEKDTDTECEDNIRTLLASFDDFETLQTNPTYEDLLFPLINQPEEDESLLTWPSDDVDIFDTSTTPLSPRTIQSFLDNETDSKEAVKLPDNRAPLSSPNNNIACKKYEEISESNYTPTSTKIEENHELLSKRSMLQDSDGDTYLHILLSKEGKQYTEQCLLCIPRCISGKKGLDAINRMGQTALHMSSYTTNIDVTKALLENGAEPSLLDREGNSCLHIACELNSHPLVKCILSTLQSMKNRTAKDIVNLTNSLGLAPIHIATVKENISVVQVLHEYGANIDQQDDCSRKTPLMLACESNQVKAVALFIERLHADVNIRTLSDYSALHIASEVNNLEIVKTLLKNGAQVGTKTAYLKTEKDLSTNSEVKLLLERYLRKTRRRKGSSSDPYG